MAGSLKMNECTKSTFRIAIETNFEIICTLKCMVHWLPYYQADWLATTTEIRKVKKVPTSPAPPAPFLTISITEINWACMEQEIK